MKIITEVTQDLHYLSEANEKGGKSMYIEGIFMQAEKPNRNGRMYPRGIMEAEVGRYQQLIEQKRSLGELGHPANPSVNLDKVSHLITNLRFEGNDIYGKAKILDTPMGKIAKNFIEEGVKLGVSSRGLGSLKMNKQGVNEVQQDFHLATVDIVADPSAPDAFVQGIMENREWIYVEGRGWIAEEIKSQIQTMSVSTLNEKKLDLFKRWLDSVK